MRILKYLFLLALAGVLLGTFASFSVLKTAPNIKHIRNANCPIVDYSNHNIIQPTCGRSDGAITGIKVTSTGTKIIYTWRDAAKNIVGQTLDLKNVPTGSYSLEVSDNSGCGSSVFTPYFFLDNANSVKMDQTGVQIKSSTCKNDGSITAITASGATNYDWTNTATKTLVSTSTTSADLLNVGPGSYQLRAYNSTCEILSKVFFVLSQMQVPTVIDAKITNPLCGGSGSITITLEVMPGQPKLSIFLTNSLGLHIYDGVVIDGNINPVINIRGLDGGDYSLYVQDANNCSVLLGTYTVQEGVLAVSPDTKIINDRCNQHLGFVVPVITGYTPSKFDEYTWTDVSSGQVVGNNRALSNVGAGTYKLHLLTVSQCRLTQTFTVENVAPTVIPPVAEGSTLCLPGVINIRVTNLDTAETFNLYASADAATPLESNPTGIFYRQIDQTTDFYITRVHGDCESLRTKVTEVVVVAIKIPNAFSPNGDGINDYWNIAGIEKFPGADIKIYTRDGQLIFHSINYPTPFNGTYKGSELPAGVYYYVMDVKQPICYGKIAGSLTIIR
ncbi:MAG: gliding motility-associated C-terminal domain-containing protein [Mucilaginibacter sp.]